MFLLKFLRYNAEFIVFFRRKIFENKDKYYIMKLANLLTILLLIFTSSFAGAQTLKSFKKEMNNLSGALELDAKQVDQLTQIYEKRVSDLNLIESMESSNEAIYREKRRAIYQSSEVSIKRMLTREQLEKFVVYNRGVREIRARQIAKLRKKNASLEDIKDAHYGVL